MDSKYSLHCKKVFFSPQRARRSHRLTHNGAIHHFSWENGGAFSQETSSKVCHCERSEAIPFHRCHCERSACPDRSVWKPISWQTILASPQRDDLLTTESTEFTEIKINSSLSPLQKPFLPRRAQRSATIEPFRNPLCTLCPLWFKTFFSGESHSIALLQ